MESGFRSYREVRSHTVDNGPTAPVRSSKRRERLPSTYPTGRKIKTAEMAKLDIVRDEFHGEWNYTLPREGLTDRLVLERSLRSHALAAVPCN